MKSANVQHELIWFQSIEILKSKIGVNVSFVKNQVTLSQVALRLIHFATCLPGYLLTATLFASLNQVIAAVADVPLRRYDSPIRGEMAEHAQNADHLGNHFLRVPSSSDYQATIGTLIDSGCFVNQSSTGTTLNPSAFELILNRVLLQLTRCDQALRLPSVRDSISILRRLKLTCNPAPYGGRASSTLNRWRPEVAPLTVVNSGYDRSYTINFPLERISNMSLVAALSRQSERLDHSDSVEISTFVEVMIHEILHNTPSNNRIAHDVAMEALFYDSCVSENSIFLDRVYLTAAACTPNSHLGRRLREGGCQNHCERAFTEVDSMPFLAQARETATIQPFGVIGPPLLATRTSPQEARIFCQRIAQVHRSYAQMRSAADEVTNRFDLLLRSRFIPDTQSNPQSLELRRLLEMSRHLTTSHNRWIHVRNQIQGLLSSQCNASPVAESWRPLCEVGGEPANDALGLADSYFQLTQEVTLNNARLGMPSVEQIMEFYNE